MAAAAVERESLSCPICFELYKIPRTLPCLHSFCEGCLSSYITSSFISTGQEPIGFNCPFCRTLINSSKPSEDPSTWVNCYHINEELQFRCVERKSKDAERKSCDICEGGKIDAAFWCRECKACLCVDCKDNHGRFPVLNSHTVCDVQDISLGTLDSLDYQNCKQHFGRKYEMYCMDHEKLCCAICLVKSHKKCDVIMPITDAANIVRGKIDTFALTTDLAIMKKENDVVSEHVERSLGLLATKRYKFDQEKTSFRERIIERIDSIEKQLTADIDAKEESFQSKCQRELKKSRHRENVIKNLQRLLHASAAQEDTLMFVEINKVLQIYNRYQNELIGFRNNFREFDYHVSFREMEEQLEKSFECLGKLEVKFPMIPNFSLSQIKKGAIKRLYNHFAINNAIITGGAFLDNGHVLVIDNGLSKLQTYDGKGTFISELVFTSKPWDVTCINENVVAVTIPARKIISLVRLSDMAVLKNIPIEGECYGLSFSMGKLAVSVSNGILLMDTDGKVHSKLQTPVTNIQYVQFKGKDIVSCSGGYALCELKPNGTIITDWKHSDLQYKISTDCDENLYTVTDKRILQLDQNNSAFYFELKFPQDIAKSALRVVAFQKNSNKFVVSWDKKFVGTFEIIPR